MPITPRQLEAISRASLNQTEAVRLGDLLHEIEELILRYITLPQRELASLIAVWIAGTYLYIQFEYFGYWPFVLPRLPAGNRNYCA